MLKLWLFSFGGGVCLLACTAAGLTLVQSRRADPYRWAGPTAGSPPHYERIDAIEAVKSARLPRVGETAEYLSEPDEVGAPFYLQGHLREHPVLLGAFCTCSTCRETAKWWNRLAKKRPGKFQAAAIVSLEPGGPSIAFSMELGLGFPLLPDPNHALSARFPGPGQGSAALGCPRAWVIGKDGRYRYVMPMGSAPTPAVRKAIVRALGLTSE